MTPEQALGLAEHHRQGGRHDLAESLCRQLLRARPRHAQALHLLGIIRHDAGSTAEGIEFVRQAISADAGIALYHGNLCEMYRRNGQLAQAVEAGQGAIALAPDSPQVHNSLGIAYIELGRREQAIEHYRRAIALDPAFAEAHSNLGNALGAARNFAESIAAHRRAVALKPDYATAHVNLGTTLRQARRFAEAESSYRDALALNPRDPSILNNLALCAVQQRRFDEAAALLSQAATIAPRNVETLVVLTLLLIERNEIDKAKAVCEQALALDPDRAETLNFMGRIASAQGRSHDAVAYARKAIARNPAFATAHNNLGNALRELGDIDGARTAFTTALEHDSMSTGALLNLADVHRFVRDDPYLAAMEALAANVDTWTDEEQIQLQFALAKAHADVDEHERSLAHLLRGNALKRRQIRYDENAMLGLSDRIRAVFTAELLELKQGGGCPSAEVILIVGMPRSGTTLIEQILASHRQVFGAGEVPDLGRLTASARDASGRTLPYPEFVGAMDQALLRQFGAAYRDGLRRHAPTAERITDKTPQNFLHLGLIHLVLPNARVIHVRRDPLDTCLSCFSKLFAGEQPYAYDLAELGHYYRAYETLMAHWRDVLPPAAMLEVQYEDVVSDTEQAARKIVAYCGLPWDPACLQFHRAERPVRTASAAQVRQPIYRHAIGRSLPYKHLLEPLLEALGGAKPLQ
jgi:tetratricopeptide (TPR) repeat protein